MPSRILLLLGACLILAWPAPARAQGGQASPLAGCQHLALTFTGPQEMDNEKKTGRISGAVQIECDGTSIFAEEVWWTEKTLFAKGNLLIVQEGLRVSADHMEMDRATRLGVFHQAYGTARLTERPVEKNMFGTLEPEVMFRGALLEKIGPRTYRLTDGAFSTCVQPTPRWDMTGTSGTVTLDEHVVLRNAVLRVKRVPVFYLPVIYYPLGGEDRASGFLLPTYSSSSIRGTGLSNAYFLVLGRSQDATFYHDWFSSSGQGVGAEYRYEAAPGSGGTTSFYMLNERERLGADGTVERQARRSYDLRGNVNQALPRGFRLIGRANYYSDASTQQLYQQSVYDLSQRDRYFGGTVTGTFGRYRFSGLVERRDVFLDLTRALRTGRAPQINIWVADKPVGRSRVYFGAIGEGAYVINSPDISRPETDRSLWRYDGTARVRAPLSRLPYLSFTTAASWRLTEWRESLDPETGIQRPIPITRSLIGLNADVIGPVFTRVFQTPDNGYAERFKHLIEPRLSIQWLSPFDRLNEVVRIDQIDTQVGGTTTVSYSLWNRLMARRRTGGVREMVAVGVSQSYFSNALAGTFDPQHPSSGSSTFSPVQVTASATPVDGLSGRFQMYIDATTRSVLSYSASGTAVRSLVQVSAGWSKRQVVPGVPGYDQPSRATHYLNATATLRLAEGRLGGTYGFNYDVKNKGFLQQRIVAYYNAQCCGVSVDYQTVDVTNFGFSNLTKDRRFGISFTLAGIGSFSNPMGSFGDNGGRR